MWNQQPGGISWVDLTVENASELKDFYCKVLGFNASSISMSEYEDFVIQSPSDPDLQFGICHAKGVNQDLPPQWLIYFNVKDIDLAVKACIDAGGEVIRAKQTFDHYSLAVVKDPAGAGFALVEND